MSETLTTQVAVVGGGPGGYAAAFMAADLGLDVVLVDTEENPGGTCLYRGCIPSKALLHVAKLIGDAQEAKAFGLDFGAPKIDLDVLRAKAQAIVAKMTGGLGQLSKARKVRYVRARANFIDTTSLSLFESDVTEDVLKFEHCILACGSRPARFGPLIDSPRIMNSTDALELPDVPGELLVIGGGYIGLELGSVYARLGAKVTVVEATPGLLPGADRDLVEPLANRLEGVMHEILLDTKVTSMTEAKAGIKVTLEGAKVKKPTRIYDKVLVCVGRKPNSSGLGLNCTKVEVDDKGFIQVDEQMRTAEPNIFAIGDLVKGPMLAHKATAEGRVAAQVIAGQNVAFEPQAIPAVVFTDPEIAWCGLTESEAAAQEREVVVTRYPWSASGRATTLDRNEGLTKLLTDPQTHQILGVGIVGEGAGEMIAEAALAIEMGATATDVDLTIHAHPTLSETVMEAASSIFGHATHIYRPKRG